MASNLTTRSLVKEHLDINVTDFDDVIDTTVDGVNEGLENFLDVTFAETTYTNEEYDIPQDSHILTLKNRPVTTFTTLQEKDNPGDFDSNSWTTIDTDEYDVNTEEGQVYWNGLFRKGKGRYRATYDAGYATIPDDITLAATKVAASLVENRKGSGVTSETLGQYSRTFSADRSTFKNLDIDIIINKYKNRNLSWFTTPLIVGPRNLASSPKAENWPRT